MPDPKQIRFDAYAKFRELGDITFSDEEMEKQMATPEGRQSFHQYLGNRYGDVGAFEDWEAKFFPEYSKKKDSGGLDAGSDVSSSATEPPVTPEIKTTDITPRELLKGQGVTFAAPSPVDKEAAPIDQMTTEEIQAQLAGVTFDPNERFDLAKEMAQFKESAYIDVIKNAPLESFTNSNSAFNILTFEPSAKRLFSDPDASDFTRGQLKFNSITEASDLLNERIVTMQQGIDEDIFTRYMDTKAALIELYESGDPLAEVDGRGIDAWASDFEVLFGIPEIAEYDDLVTKSYAIGQVINNIKNEHPDYFNWVESQGVKQRLADMETKAFHPGIMKYPRVIGSAAMTELSNLTQGLLASVSAAGNTYFASNERYDWADALAEWTLKNVSPPMQFTIPSFAQRDLFTTTARLGKYQVDVDARSGNVVSVRDKEGYIVFNEDVVNKVKAEFEAAPDKYNPKFRPNLAPSISIATQGVMQVLATSRFAGLGRTAAAAKGISAGVLTARYSGQNYLQALEEFGPENADVAARFAIGTAALQSAISIYFNPLEIKLNPKFNVNKRTFKKVAQQLDAGTPKEVALRNGWRAYSEDLARGVWSWSKEVGKEGLEGVMEMAVDIGGRTIVRSSTDIDAEYDATWQAMVNALSSEMVGASMAGMASVNMSANWQREALIIAYENQAEILPMIEKLHGPEAAEKVKMVFALADKATRGKRITREQKNEVLKKAYEKVTTVEEGGDVEVPEAPVVQAPEPAPEAIAEEPLPEPTGDIYDVLREEARTLLLEPGTTYVNSAGVEYTVVGPASDPRQIIVRNGDDGREEPVNIADLQDTIRASNDERIARQFPGMASTRVQSIRRGLAETAAAGELPPAAPRPMPPDNTMRNQAMQQGLELGLSDPVVARAVDTANEPGVKSLTVQQAEGRSDFYITVEREDGSSEEQVFSHTGRKIRTRNRKPATSVEAPPPVPTTEEPATQAEPQVTEEAVAPAGVKQVAPRVYTRANIAEAEGIDGAAIGQMLDVVAEVAPDIEVQVFETQAEMEAAVGAQGNALISRDGKTIYLSKESNLADARHEVIHPIVIAAELRQPGTIERFYTEILSTMPEQVRNEMEEFAAGYSEYSEADRREEVVVEFLNRMADGQYDESVFGQEGYLDRLLNWFSDIFNKLGLTNPPSDLDSLKAFSRRVVDAFKTGATIEMDEGIEPSAPSQGTKASRRPKKVFRGVGDNVAGGENEGILWVAENPEVAKNYAGPDGVVQEYDIIPPNNPIELPWGGGTYVKGSDVSQFLINIAEQRLEAGNINEESLDKFWESIALFEAASNETLELPLTKINKAVASRHFVDAAKTLGFDGVIQMEAPTKGGEMSITYGLFKQPSVKPRITPSQGVRASMYNRLRGRYIAVPNYNQPKYKTYKLSDIPAKWDAKGDKDTADFINLMKSLSGLTPNATVFIFDNRVGLNQYTGHTSANAAIERDLSALYFSLESPKGTFYHEAFHIIAKVKMLQDRAFLRSVKSEILDELPNNIKADINEFTQSYIDAGIWSSDDILEEAVVEFFARITSGQYDISLLGEKYGQPKSLQDKLIELINKWFKSFGVDIKIKGRSELKDFMESVVNAMRSGELIVIDNTGNIARQEGVRTSTGGDVKPRIIQNALSPAYYRAKKWMQIELARPVPPGAPTPTRDDIITDAMGTFDITRAQAEVMFDVIIKSPATPVRTNPVGVDRGRTGVLGAIDWLSRTWNGLILKSKGMPNEVLQAMEASMGEAEIEVARAIEGYERITSFIATKKSDEQKELTQLANDFISGKISEADIARIPDELYTELVMLRSRIDSLSADVLNEAEFREIREEIISENFGNYVSRIFKAHLSAKYSPSKAARKKFVEEFRRRNFDGLAEKLLDKNPNATATEIDEFINKAAETAWKTLLQKHRMDDKISRGWVKSKKPTGFMQERKELPRDAATLWEAIDEGEYGGVMMPAKTGRNSNTGDPDFDAAFAKAWDAMWNDRSREAYFTHKEHSKEYNRLEKQGQKAMSVATRMGLAIPGTNPVSKENLRAAVENGTPINLPMAPATMAGADAYNALVNDIQAGVDAIRQAIDDKVQVDMDAIVLGKDIIESAEGFRRVEHLTPGARAILGEIPPLEASVMTVAKLAKYAALTKYYRKLRAEGEGKFLFADDEDAVFRPTWAKVQIPGTDRGPNGVVLDATSERLAPLSGMWTSPEIAKMLTNMSAIVDMSWDPTLAVAYFTVGKINEWLTVFSPRTQAKNFFSNFLFVIRNAWAYPHVMAMAFLYVPADIIYASLSGGKRISAGNKGVMRQLRGMSDAILYGFAQNFGAPKWMKGWEHGIEGTYKIDMAEFGFTDSKLFNDAKTLLEGAIRSHVPRKTAVANAVSTLGITPDQARGLHAALSKKNFKDEMREVLYKLHGAGLLGTSVSLGIIDGYLETIDSRDKATAFIANKLFYEDPNPARRAAKKAAGKAARAYTSTREEARAGYSFGDDAFKIFGYLEERAAYAQILFDKPYYLLDEAQQAEVDRIAIENVKNIQPNYDRIGELGKIFSRSIFVTQFISFKMEAWRTMGNSIALAAREIEAGRRTGNTKMLLHGSKRMASVAAMETLAIATEASLYSLAKSAIPAALQWMGNYLWAMDDDDEDNEVKEMTRELLPAFMQRDYFIPTKYTGPETGDLTLYSVSSNHPYGDFQRALVDLDMRLSDEDPEIQDVVYAFLSLFGDFSDIKIFQQLIIELGSNQDAYGNDIVTLPTVDFKGDSWDERFKKRLAYVIRRAGPGYINQAGRLGLLDYVLPETETFSQFRKPPYAEEWYEELFSMATGLKPYTVNIYDDFQDRVNDFFTGYGKTGIQNKIYGSVKPRDLNISDDEFEFQMKRMMQEEYATLLNLRKAYWYPIKHGLTFEDKMRQRVTDKWPDGLGLSTNPDTKMGRNTIMILKGQYRGPVELVNEYVVKRMEVNPDYELSQEFIDWARNFEQEKQKELETLR